MTIEQQATGFTEPVCWDGSISGSCFGNLPEWFCLSLGPGRENYWNVVGGAKDARYLAVPRLVLHSKNFLHLVWLDYSTVHSCRWKTIYIYWSLESLLYINIKCFSHSFKIYWLFLECSTLNGNTVFGIWITNTGHFLAVHFTGIPQMNAGIWLLHCVF